MLQDRRKNNFRVCRCRDQTASGFPCSARAWLQEMRRLLSSAMRSRFPLLVMLLVATANILGLRSVQAADRPGVFVTHDDIARVRQGAATAAGGRWADELIKQAESIQLAELPRLERVWWETARTKPWQEIYPEVFHHTWIVPGRWAAAARKCAWAGVLRPDSQLADKAQQALLSLAEFTFEFEHFDVGLNYTAWVLHALETYDLLYDRFTPEQRERIDACFARYLTAVKKNDDYWLAHEPGGAINNHYAWHKLGFVAIGLFYNRQELVTQALEGPHGIDFLMQYGFTDDGLWAEGSIPYQLTATAPLVKAAELLENCHHPRDLYRSETGDGRSLIETYDALLQLLLPDRTLPTIGDCYGRRPLLGTSADWEILARRFKDPHRSWLLRGLPQRSSEALLQGQVELPDGVPPHVSTRLWPEHGYAMLRETEGADYWSGRGWTLLATYSHNRVHENLDKLSIILFGEGHLWLPDCEAVPSAEHSFSANIQRELNRQTLCHNTLLVDRKSQHFPDQPLQLIEFQDLPALKRVTIGDLAGRLYPGVRQMRTCLVRNQYVLDFFQVQCDGPRDFDWLVHIDAQSLASPPPDGELEWPQEMPWNYLRAPKRLGQSISYAETFRHDDQSFRLDVLASCSQEIIGCGFPRDDSPDPSVIPLRIFRCCQQQSAWYAALYRVGSATTESADLTVEPGELANWRVVVRFPDRQFVHRIPLLPDDTPVE